MNVVITNALITGPHRFSALPDICSKRVADDARHHAPASIVRPAFRMVEDVVRLCPNDFSRAGRRDQRLGDRDGNYRRASCCWGRARCPSACLAGLPLHGRRLAPFGLKIRAGDYDSF
jgi:hypothetical protein